MHYYDCLCSVEVKNAGTIIELLLSRFNSGSNGRFYSFDILFEQYNFEQLLNIIITVVLNI